MCNYMKTKYRVFKKFVISRTPKPGETDGWELRAGGLKESAGGVANSGYNLPPRD